MVSFLFWAIQLQAHLPPSISLISCKARSKVPSAAARNKFSRAKHFKASTCKKQNFTKLYLWELYRIVTPYRTPLTEDDVENPIPQSFWKHTCQGLEYVSLLLGWPQASSTESWGWEFQLHNTSGKYSGKSMFGWILSLMKLEMEQDHLHWHIIVDLEFGHLCSMFHEAHEFSTKCSAKSPADHIFFEVLPFCLSW